ncbi:UPF0688 protein C1orf174 homolog isoform X2 [Betta splendens]|uniref:UPF0688 protein C1orf174 homolog isoform X2 n=1 Tax=Betta splendens TaxID=158456 RepID=A0A6P7N046_BETSP|nr:UPF0688 protein C1orf174 homolog isoform X2 [Betta splendens]
MTPRMSGQINNLKPRKRKSSSEVKRPRMASATRRRCPDGPKTRPAAGSSCVGGAQSTPPSSLERSRIACECHPATGARRCSASPELQGRDGKENETGPGAGAARCGGKAQPEDMDSEDASKSIFPDDDSNQILPVEQFFGNMDAVQDFPQRSPATSASVPREHRRRHYYAREDSDEDEDEGRGSTGGAS